MLDTPITERQFTALMKVCGIGSNSPTHTAMKLVLVQGKTPKDAAEATSLAYATVSGARSKVVSRYAGIDSRIALLQEARG